VSAASASYICAIGEVYECTPVTGCKRAALQDINLSPFIMFDAEKKQLTSIAVGEEVRTEEIEGISTTDKFIFLHGTQDVETWNAVISLEDGRLSGGISNATSSFAIFGNCTPKP
jgi:hypothetical protein